MEWGALTYISIFAPSLTYSLLNQLEQAEIPANRYPTPRFFMSINTLTLVIRCSLNRPPPLLPWWVTQRAWACSPSAECRRGLAQMCAIPRQNVS